MIGVKRPRDPGKIESDRELKMEGVHLNDANTDISKACGIYNTPAVNTEAMRGEPKHVLLLTNVRHEGDIAYVCMYQVSM